jgi:hypothetical protein
VSTWDGLKEAVMVKTNQYPLGTTGRDEEESKSSPAGVQEEATYYDKELPFGWIRVKLEPDC